MSEDDTQVIALQANEIEFVREAAQTQVTRGTDGTEFNRQVFLEIGLKDADTTALEKALAEEASRPGWGTDRHRTKFLDNPVQLVDQSVLRIAWKGNTATMRPKIKAALQALGQIAEVQDRRKSVEDFTVTGLKKLETDEQNKKLAELARMDKIKAVNTVKQLHGCSLTEASHIVDDLIAGVETQPKG